jgi:hypothetical protein
MCATKNVGGLAGPAVMLGTAAVSMVVVCWLASAVKDTFLSLGGLLHLLCLGVLGVAAILSGAAVLCGGVAMVCARRNALLDPARRAGLAGSGLGMLAFVGVVWLGGVFWSDISPWKREEMFENERVEMQLQHLCQSAQAYASWNDGKFPSADSWPQDLGVAPYELAIDPHHFEAGRAWAMNQRMAGVRLQAGSRRHRTVLFFECRPGSPLSGGQELLPAKPRLGNAYFVGLADGRAVRVAPKEMSDLVWEP